MAYEPTTWAAGDVVTSAKLNKLEQGVVNAGDVFVVTITPSSATAATADKTFAEIKAASDAGKTVIGAFVAGQYAPILSGCAVAGAAAIMSFPFLNGSGKNLGISITGVRITASGVTMTSDVAGSITLT